MKIYYKTVLGVLAGLFLSIIVPAQNLPVIPAEKSIAHGTLPNGMAYYVVENPTESGMADFELVKKGEGTLFSKNDVMLSFSEYVIDSTLLHIMNLADVSSPSDQAVIVSGNVNAKSVVEKIRMLSYMTPVKDTAVRDPYVWKATEGLEVLASSDPDRKQAVVTVTWRSQRTPYNLMNTIQPEISSLFTAQLGIIACDRLELCLKQAEIPAAAISYSHINGAMTPGDEEFSVTVSIAPEHMENAVKILSYVMSSLDSGSATLQEIRRSEAAYIAQLYKAVSSPISRNSEYMERCSSSFLYNGTLASPRAIYDFHVSRHLDDQTSLSLFNGIASALLGKNGNLTLECITPEAADSERLSSLFTSAWDKKSEMVWKDKADISSVLEVANPEKKMKIRSTRKDPMSGGSVMILENGFTVICRDMPSERNIHYSLSLNGGFGDISGLYEGEGAYVEDFINTCRVSGMPVGDFRKGLAEIGISMDIDVDIAGMSVSGSAKGEDILTVIQALSALTRKIEQDEKALEYFLKAIPMHAESMKGTRLARESEIAGIMCPDYKYSDIKVSSSVSPDFSSKMWRYVTERFSSLDDGVLVIVGDVDEAELRKILALYGHEFKTVQRSSFHPSIRFQTISGVSTYTVKGESGIVDLAMSARYPFTSDNYSACMIASMALKNKLSETFEDSGWNVNVRQDFTIHPDERFNVLVTLEEDGTDVSLTPMEAMSVLRSAVSSLASEGVDGAHISAYRNHLKNRMNLMKMDASFWVEMISSRHLYGKDILTGFASRCDAVTPAMVKNVLSVLDRSGKVEYITETE